MPYVAAYYNIKNLILQAVTGGFEDLRWITIDGSGGRSLQQQCEELQQVEIDFIKVQRRDRGGCQRAYCSS
jgi:hypothetical protein